MILNFKKIEEREVEQFKGGEKSAFIRGFEDENNKIMLFRLEPGASVGRHRHQGNSETIYLLKGRGKVLSDGTYHQVSAGQCLYCPEGEEHSLINDGDEDLIFFAVVPEHHR